MSFRHEIRFWQRPAGLALIMALVAGCDAGVIEKGTQGDDPSGPSEGAEPQWPEIAPLSVCSQNADFSTIQGAIDAAKEGQRIEVCAGTYPESLVVHSSVRIVGIDGAAATIIDAEGLESAVVLTGVATPGLGLEGFTIKNGAASLGAGIHCESSALTLKDSVIRSSSAGSGGALSASKCQLLVTTTQVLNNQATGSGGALFLEDSTGLVTDSVIENNSAHRGGGIVQIEGSVSIRRSEIRDNEAVDIGGGIYHDSDGAVTDNHIANNVSGERGGGLAVIAHAPMTSNNLVIGNQAGDDGGGIYLYISSATIADSIIEDNHAEGDAGGLRILGSTATITGNQILDNTAVGDGGGMKISHNQSVVENNLFDGNLAHGYGGGVELDDDWSTLSNLTITNNTAYRGGGLHVYESGADFRVEHTLIANNTATTSGGGVRFDYVWSTGTFSFVTMVGNSAQEVGGADFADAEEELDPEKPIRRIRVDNSIIADNDGVQVRNQGGIIEGWNYNNVSPSDFVGMTDPSGSEGNISVRPDFIGPSDYDFQLKAESQCRDAGDPNLSDIDGSRADMGRFGGPGVL